MAIVDVAGQGSFVLSTEATASRSMTSAGVSGLSTSAVVGASRLLSSAAISSAVFGAEVSAKLYKGVSAQAELLLTGSVEPFVGTVVFFSGLAGVAFEGSVSAEISSVIWGPSVPRVGIGTIDDVGPVELMEPAMKSTTHKMSVLGPFQFGIAPSGDFTLGGPANEDSTPKLGYKRGDKIRILSSGAPNDGREFTLINPDTVEVLERIIQPDTDDYDFELVRRYT